MPHYEPQSNVSPRHDEELLKRKLPADKIALIQRLEAAQTNGFENLPLFIGAVLLSAIAKVPEEAVSLPCTFMLSIIG